MRKQEYSGKLCKGEYIEDDSCFDGLCKEESIYVPYNSNISSKFSMWNVMSFMIYSVSLGTCCEEIFVQSEEESVLALTGLYRKEINHSNANPVYIKVDDPFLSLQISDSNMWVLGNNPEQPKVKKEIYKRDKHILCF